MGERTVHRDESLKTFKSAKLSPISIDSSFVFWTVHSDGLDEKILSPGTVHSYGTFENFLSPGTDFFEILKSEIILQKVLELNFLWTWYLWRFSNNHHKVRK